MSKWTRGRIKMQDTGNMIAVINPWLGKENFSWRVECTK